MPYIFGNIYPEIKSAGMASVKYKIFVISNGRDEETAIFTEKIIVLKEYLKSLKDSIVDVEVCATFDETPEDASLLGIKLIDKSEHNYKPERIKEISQKFDIDLVVTHDEKIRESLATHDFESLNFEEAYRNIEIFVKGHEIPWVFDDIVWNRTWTTFYAMNDDTTKKIFNHYYSSFSKLGIKKDSLEMIRTLVLRMSNICYTRDKLLFYVIQKRIAKRHKLIRQDFTFEASYFLCHYYILLWGGVDQLARIINKILDIQEKDLFKIGLNKKSFLEKIRVKSQSIADLYLDPKFNDWIKKLKINRHYIAHEGSLTLSPLLEEAKKGISDEIIEKEALESQEYNLIKGTMPSEVVEWFLALIKENIKISKHKLIADDITVMRDCEKQYVFRPLNNIEWDFNNFKIIVIRTFEELEKYAKEEKLD